MPKSRTVSFLAAAVALFSTCATVTWASTTQPESIGGAIALGKVTHNPELARRALGPFGAYVGLHLEDLGITGIRLVFTATNEEMATLLRAGRVDWITETAAAASAFVDDAGAEILARRWQRGAPEYQTIIFARRNSDILSLADLAGRTIAFEHPRSVPAYFIPAHAILHAGLALEPLEDPDPASSNDSVKFIFSRDDLVTSAWVIRGKVDAGALSNRDWTSDDTIPTAHRVDLRIIYTSGKFPYALDLVRTGLDPELKTRIRQALLEAHKTRGGRAALRAYNRTARYDEAPARVTRSIAELRDIRKSVEARLPRP